MKPVSSLVVAAVSMACVGQPSAQGVPINLRMGGWDTVMTTTVNGKTQVSKFKTCVTKEDLESLRTFEKDEDCKYRWSSRTASRITGTTRCTVDGKTREGEIDVQIAGPESYQMTGGMKISDKADGAVRFEMKARWANASCKGYDD
jgi:hypothetical protein